MLRNKWLIVAAFACVAAGCRAPTEPKPAAAAPPPATAPMPPATLPPPVAAPPPAAAGGPPGAAPPPGILVYHIDAERSQLRLLVYRAGALARLGHDHVILARGLGGWIAHPEEAAEASLYLQVTVDEFVVDDSEARAQAGPEFAEPVDDEAKAGTRHNMLGAALLDADAHPLIEVHGSAFDGVEPDLRATLRVSIAGHDSTLVVPFRLRRSAGELTASADFPLRQTSLGLTPYSVMMGALRVEDEIQVKLSLVATAR
jgi:hypothetical protein